ncbi:TetR family transcriptional regulator [Pseudoroseomonas wenyumeiae]|uniref:TetR family transcriptional regulator n=1 Tax=Teichococcus wenyumeiae TaxID=2478470 RepID=A0A3A9JAR2_9PROT|nr:TetR/AcrR family transcriptional regulator [Pseudoroseomonas wenyumeiae]RKK02611.1 TetR/AcrR family transcriptional regulator [Pseudoroseomonas wenyumeiae]RMI15369.1 TetR family transcriptional regulator [Pseudoroseomonas wenyumeiae]
MKQRAGDAGANAREAILAAARKAAQAHGYGGLNIRALADGVGIKGASIYYHFPSKADLGAAVARRYWEDSAADLDALWGETSDPLRCLHDYPDVFRKSLESENRLCLCSFMAAEYDDLPDVVKREVQAFADVHVAWLSKMLFASSVVSAGESGQRARSIYAAVAGAQLMARSRSDIALYDALIDGYRAAGLLPTLQRTLPEPGVDH